MGENNEQTAWAGGGEGEQQKQSKKAWQKTRLYSGFKNHNKKNPRNEKTRVDSSLFMNSIL